MEGSKILEKKQKVNPFLSEKQNGWHIPTEVTITESKATSKQKMGKLNVNPEQRPVIQSIKISTEK